ncbi:MAG: class I SAM-dependent methyltransferase [Pseudomonadota bacterium]
MNSARFRIIPGGAPDLTAALARIRKYEQLPPSRLDHEWYSIGRCFRSWLSLPSWFPLLVHVDHGVPVVDEVYEGDRRTSLPLLVVNEGRRRAILDETGRDSVVTGSPFVHYRRKAGYAAKRGRTGTIAFPIHSTELIEVDTRWEDYAEALLDLPLEFHPVSIGLYWLDIKRGAAKPFLERGIPVVTAGHHLDPHFVDSFYHILSSHRYCTSNVVGSCAFYSIELGIPFFIYGSSPLFVNRGDSNRPAGTYDLLTLGDKQTPHWQSRLNFELDAKRITIEPSLAAECAERLGLERAPDRARIRHIVMMQAAQQVGKSALDMTLRRAFGATVRHLHSRLPHVGLIRGQEADRDDHSCSPIASRPRRPLVLSQDKLASVLPGFRPGPIQLLGFVPTVGGLMIHELAVFMQIVRCLKPKITFEFGTYEGLTTRQLAANGAQRVFTLDLPVQAAGEGSRPQVAELDVYPQQVGRRFVGTPEAERIVQLLGDSLTFDFTPYRHQMNLILVDACHHYRQVSVDSRSALSMVCPGGVVMWHDYAPYAPGVMKAIDELSATHRLYHIAGTSLVMHRAGDEVEETSTQAQARLEVESDPATAQEGAVGSGSRRNPS